MLMCTWAVLADTNGVDCVVLWIKLNIALNVPGKQILSVCDRERAALKILCWKQSISLTKNHHIRKIRKKPQPDIYELFTLTCSLGKKGILLQISGSIRLC